MPLSYNIDSVHRMVITRASGTMSDADIEILQTQFASDPSFDPTYAYFTDLRELKRVALSPEMHSAIQHGLVFRPSTRGAFIARSSLQVQTAREFLGMSQPDGRTTRIFRSGMAAQMWLAKKPRSSRG